MTISHSILAAAKADTPSGTAEIKLAREPRLCKDCRHAEAGAGVWYCNHPELLTLDFVQGKHTAQHCATLRAAGPRPPFVRECGPAAQYWEAKI